MDVVKLLESAPGWFQREARRFGTSVDLRYSSGYLALMGQEFFDFFRNPVNCEGEAGGWKWQVRRVDGLINFCATFRGKGKEK